MTDPFAPIPASQPSVSADNVPCGKCGAPIDPNAASYSEKGELICRRCEALETIDAGEQRAISGILGGAAGAIGLGLISFCFNPFFMMSFLALGSGIGTIATLMRHPEYKPKMGAKYGLAMGMAIIGILCGLAWPLLILLGIAGAAVTR